MKRFQCDAGEFGFDAIIRGQTPLIYNDLLTQVATQRDLRTDAVMCYQHASIEGLLAQIQDMLGGDAGTESRRVVASPYFWPEYCEDVTIITTIKPLNAVGTANQQLTVTIDSSSHSKNGLFSKPRAGFRAYIQENNNQAVNIISVAKTPTGANTMVIQGINNEIVDLTQVAAGYTLLVDTLRNYISGDTNPISTGGFVKNPPTIRKGYVQMMEDGLDISQDELNGYVYDVDFRIGKGLGPDQKEIEYYDFPLLNAELLEKYQDSKIINTVFNQRDDIGQVGFEGIVPAVDGQGMFSRDYDPGSGVSLKQIIFNWIRQLRLRNGATQNMIFHDFGFGMDWNESIAQLIGDNKQNLVYKLFGDGGEGVRNFSYYTFKDFSAYDYDFKTMRIDTFDAWRYGAPLKDFAFIMPMATYRDTKGNKVGPVTYVNIHAAEDAPQEKMWNFDWRPQGGRKVSFYVQDTWGMEIHCVSKMGVMHKASC